MLVEAVRQGELDALDTLYRRHAPALRRYAGSLCRDAETADDVVQQAFLKLVHAAAEGTRVREPRAFLIRIVRNLACDELRRQHAEPLEEDSLSARPEPVLESVAVGDWSRRLSSAIGELPDRQQAAFVLAELRGYSYDEIATVIGANPSSVGSLVHRARCTLRARVRAPALAPTGLLRGWPGSQWHPFVARLGEALTPVVAALAIGAAAFVPHMSGLLGLGGSDGGVAALDSPPLVLAGAGLRKGGAEPGIGQPAAGAVPDGAFGSFGGSPPAATPGLGSDGGNRPVESPDPGGGGSVGLGEDGPAGSHRESRSPGDGAGAAEVDRAPARAADHPGPVPPSTPEQSGSHSTETPTGHSNQVSYGVGPGGVELGQQGQFPVPAAGPSIPAVTSTGVAGTEQGAGAVAGVAELADSVEAPLPEPAAGIVEPDGLLALSAGAVSASVPDPPVPGPGLPGAAPELPAALPRVPGLPKPRDLIDAAYSPECSDLPLQTAQLSAMGQGGAGGYSLVAVAALESELISRSLEIGRETGLPSSVAGTRVPAAGAAVIVVCSDEGDSIVIGDTVIGGVYTARLVTRPLGSAEPPTLHSELGGPASPGLPPGPTAPPSQQQ